MEHLEVAQGTASAHVERPDRRCVRGFDGPGLRASGISTCYGRLGPSGGFAFAYGGLVQLLAGMWEFRNRKVFGATAFSTYGSFCIGLGLYVLLLLPRRSTTRGSGWVYRL